MQLITISSQFDKVVPQNRISKNFYSIFYLKILSIILTCTMIIYVIYWQIRWMRVIKQNKNNLKNVNCHVKDLQLKINVLTYKAQYGTWPLPNSAKKKLETNHIVLNAYFRSRRKKTI